MKQQTWDTTFTNKEMTDERVSEGSMIIHDCERTMRPNPPIGTDQHRPAMANTRNDLRGLRAVLPCNVQRFAALDLNDSTTQPVVLADIPYIFYIYIYNCRTGLNQNHTDMSMTGISFSPNSLYSLGKIWVLFELG